MKYLIQLVLVLAVMTLTSLAVAEGGKFGSDVTLTPIEGVDNWAWHDVPLSPSTNSCPGGELVIDPITGPYCADSKTGRMHFRDGASWTCTSSDDPRMTGVGVYTSNGNFDANSTGSVWGTWRIVPMEGCDKDGPYPEELVMTATSFWQGTWNGQRQIYSLNGFNFWVGDLKLVAKGIGGELAGLHFDGTMWITMYTPSPIPYEFLPPELGLFDEPEGEFIGTIKE